MRANRTCDHCGAPLDQYAPEGVCPRCMLNAGLLEPASSDPSETAGPTDSPEGLFSPNWKINLGRFGDYELLDEIAHGGMGVVYRARQINLNRTVAVKMLLLGQFSSAESIQRFQREATAAAGLQHPNIVAIHEVGAIDGQHFFSMDYVEGRSLAAIIREKPLPARAAATYCQAIAEAIAYAHGRGIIHRDLKPSNVLIDIFDQVRITDFGLAKRFGDSTPHPASGHPLPSSDEGRGQGEGSFKSEIDLTLTGQVLGSPNYFAPELAAGKHREAGPATDVYSIGAMLYECLTGRPPFLAESLQETLLKIRDTEVPAPRLLNARIPRELETICLKCLEKNPASRYATAEELAADLDRFLKGEPIHARAVTGAERTWRWCRRKPALASFIATTALLLLAILIGSPIFIYRINQALNRAEAGELAARRSQYASDMNLAQRAVEEDDFQNALQLLDRHRPQTKSEIRNPKSEMDLRGWEWRYLWKQCQGDERFVLWEQTNAATHPNYFSAGLLADGKTVFSAPNEKVVRLWDIESRREIARLSHSGKVVGAAASPDGRWLATATRKSDEPQPVLLWDLATRRVAAALATNSWLRPRSIIVSPDSQWLAFGTAYDGIRLWDVNARSEITNLPAFQPLDGPLAIAFSPDGHLLAYSENEQGVIALWDTSNRSLIGRLTNHQDHVMALAFSPDSRTLASGGQDRTAKVWNLADRQVRFTITNHSGGVISLAFSPDGRTLAIGASGGTGRIIRLVDVETRVQTAGLRGHRKQIMSVAFTPDGRTLISASMDGTIRVWDPLPRPKEKLAHLFARDSISTAWRGYGDAYLSSDGRHLLTVYTNQSFGLWDALRFEEGERHPLPCTNTTCAAVAPGGKLAGFGSSTGELLLWDVEAGQKRFSARPTTNEVYLIAFSPDGRQVASASGNNAIRVWDVSTQTERHLPTAGEFPSCLEFSADGTALVVGFSTGPVKLLRLDGPGEAVTFLGHESAVEGLALLPDAQTLITFTTGDDICFWDVRTRHKTYPITPRGGLLDCIALSTDGRRLAAAAPDGSITIYDVASHEEVGRLAGHRERVTDMAFTPDGDNLVSVSKNQLRVWRAASLTEADGSRHSK